jgi:hypothetical protein
MPRIRFGGMSISDIESILAQRRGELTKLRKHRAEIARELAQLDHKIESLGGGRSRGGRARNEKSLTTILEDVLQKSGKPMQVGDIVEKVQDAGYRSSSANFRGIVNQTLIKDKRFSSAGRGMYQLKK